MVMWREKIDQKSQLIRTVCVRSLSVSAYNDMDEYII